MKVGIAASRFNQFIVEQLIEGARDALQRNGVDEPDTVVAWVPGAFELPIVAEDLGLICPEACGTERLAMIIPREPSGCCHWLTPLGRRCKSRCMKPTISS